MDGVGNDHRRRGVVVRNGCSLEVRSDRSKSPAAAHIDHMDHEVVDRNHNRTLVVGI